LALVDRDVIFHALKRPSPIMRVNESAAVERVLYGFDRLTVLVCEHLLPLLFQVTVQSRSRSRMCAEQRSNDGRVYEDDGIRYVDERWADCLTAWRALTTLLASSEVVAAFEK
jgi:hypothetical protein